MSDNENGSSSSFSGGEGGGGTWRGARPAPLGSLIASARRLTSRTLASRAVPHTARWQEDAWDMYGQVGEQRYLASTLASRMGGARLYVGRLTDNSTDAPEPVEDESLKAILNSIGSSPAARAQLIVRLGINLFIAGDGWLCGIPRHLLPESMLIDGSLNVTPAPLSRDIPGEPQSTGLNLEDLEWRMLSVSEIAVTGGGEVQISLGESKEELLRVNPDDVFLIRIWRPHPRRWWEADSPTCSSLPVLRELVGLTMDISAQVDSRLAGAGVFLIPQSAQRALQVAAGLAEQDGEDVFTDSLMEAMSTAISDRSNASALVPLCVTVPDETAKAFRHITFGRSLDTTGLQLREEAIRRLALGEDAPPELLLGTGGMNHWGAWLVQEDVVTTHLEPPLALICDALTTQFLWPVLLDQGMSLEEARRYVIWYDVSDLIVHPNRVSDAHALHDKGVISDEALRSAAGFDERDAPPKLPLEVERALEICTAAPSLFSSPGLDVVLTQLRAVLGGQTPPAAVEAPSSDEPTGDTVPQPVPDTEGSPARLPGSEPLTAGAVPTTVPATVPVPVCVNVVVDEGVDPTMVIPSPGSEAWDHVLYGRRQESGR